MMTMATQKEIDLALTSMDTALRDKEGRYIGDFNQWVSLDYNYIEDVELIHLQPLDWNTVK